MSSLGRMTIGQMIVHHARSYRGVRFHHQGRSRHGIDCVGLLVAVARDLQLEQVEDCTTYGRNPNPRALLKTISRSCERVSCLHDQTRLSPDAGAWSMSEPGDIVLFWVLAQDKPQHAGFRTERGMLHTWMDVRKVVEHGMTEHWLERVHSVWRYKGAATWQR